MITDADLDLARRARELAGARDMAALRAVTGAGPETDPAMVCADALGAAQYLLGELAAVIERLDGGGTITAAAQIIDAPRLAGAGTFTADVLAWCKGCRHGTASVPCGRCGGPACAYCGRCPPCDGPVPDEAE